MHTDAFVEEAKIIKNLLKDYPVDITVIRGEELRYYYLFNDNQ